MTYLQRKPYLLFLALIIVFLGFGFFNSKETLDINIHDTYFIISYWHLGLLLSFFYGFLAVIYFTLLKLNFRLINWMTITHVLVSITGFFLVWKLSFLIREAQSQNFENIIEQMDFDMKVSWAIFITGFIILFAQLLFVVNIILSLIRGRV